MRLLSTTLVLSSLLSLVLSNSSSPDSPLDITLPRQASPSRRRILSARKHGSSVLGEKIESKRTFSSQDDDDSPTSRALRRAERLALTEPDEDDVNQTDESEDHPYSSSNFNLSSLHALARRQSDAQQAAVVADTNPVDAAKLADALPGVAGNTAGNDNASGDIVGEYLSNRSVCISSFS